MIYESFIEKMGMIWTVMGLARYIQLLEADVTPKIWTVASSLVLAISEYFSGMLHWGPLHGKSNMGFAGFDTYLHVVKNEIEKTLTSHILA